MTGISLESQGEGHSLLNWNRYCIEDKSVI